MVFKEKIYIETKGNNHIIDITEELREITRKSGIKEGILLVSLAGSTGGITTIEYESGLLKDMPELLERLVPSGKTYHHDSTWGDGNGYAHLRSSLIGTSFSCPVENASPVLGTWQQVVFIDFDNRPRRRVLHVVIVGE